MIYFAIVFIATLIGGMSGMGGQLDLVTIGVLSSITVLTMSIVSVAKGLRGKLNVDVGLVTLALSGVAGGFLGNLLFGLAKSNLGDDNVNIIQIVLNLILLIFCVFQKFFKKHEAKNIIWFIAVGTLLGTLATFIGIGGGPINVALLMVVFGFDIKKSVTSSLFIIMFSQAMNVGTVAFTTGFEGLDLQPLYYMLPAAVIGGFLGAMLCKKLSEKVVKNVYTITVSGLVLLNIYNLLNLTVF